MADGITSIVLNMGFPSIESFLGLLFVVGAIIGLIAVIATIRPVLDNFPYAYPNARVRARMGRLLTEKQLTEIIETDNLEEVKNYLRGLPDYAKYVDKYPLEKALDTQLADTYDMLARITPGSIKPIFKILLQKWDINNIKSIIIAKEADLSREETVDLLVPFGDLTDSLDKLIDAKSVTEVITGLEGTEYARVLDDALQAYQNTGMILPLEASLDKYFLENLLVASSNPAEQATRTINSYIGAQVDATNLSIILRSKAEGLKYDDIQPYIVSKGYQLREWKLKELMEAEDVGSVVSSLEGTEYAQILADALPEYTQTGSVAPLEAALDGQVRKTAKALSMEIPFGLGPIVGFLNRKEKEIRNLKVITRAKREIGFPNSKIKEMLI
ncbi:V-type ATP synthase subunit C [Methanobacterium oryzae]|uniref:V-type ATP synthase subunit C n=1 Tax=Methanobacterium oryzae TaxID=69540 RepID=UPI003D238694